MVIYSEKMSTFVNKDNSFIKFITNGNKKENSILAFFRAGC